MLNVVNMPVKPCVILPSVVILCVIVLKVISPYSNFTTEFLIDDGGRLLLNLIVANSFDPLSPFDLLNEKMIAGTTFAHFYSS
jgi:hypothetical protein